jgi:2,3-bisphosphoglycerate-independent phosphoglycerate mutase
MNKLLVCILDGFGCSDETFGNATLSAPFIRALAKDGISIGASGEDVGLPHGQFGNSEVGHLTIGSGRIPKQKLQLINESIESGRLATDSKLSSFINERKNNTCHLLGLFSNGNVHSNISHFFWAIKFLRGREIGIKCHLFCDGRDVGYKDMLSTLSSALKNDDIRIDEIATIQGRFYAMDRDNRIERTQTAHDLIVHGKAGHRTNDPIATINELYDSGIHDEIMPPIVVGDYHGAVEGSSFWSLNFRADRIVQILSSLSSDNFDILSMTNCESESCRNVSALFDRVDINNTLGEVLSKNKVRQLRIAETEKYAHVTYFFNGGRDIQYELEDRLLIPSPKVDDYAKTPEMSAKLIAHEIMCDMQNGFHDVVIANFANADMIGHTGNFDAAKESLRVLDEEVKKLVKSAGECGYTTLITADHGNAECMINADATPNKMHTCSNVPFVCVPRMEYASSCGGLSDIAPTILRFLGIEQPCEMTGKSLLMK